MLNGYDMWNYTPEEIPEAGLHNDLVGHKGVHVVNLGYRF